MIDDHNIQDTRIRQLNDLDIRWDADYVLYWMQQSQRAEVNHALEYAVLQANHLEMGVVVITLSVSDLKIKNDAPFLDRAVHQCSYSNSLNGHIQIPLYLKCRMFEELIFRL